MQGDDAAALREEIERLRHAVRYLMVEINGCCSIGQDEQRAVSAYLDGRGRLPSSADLQWLLVEPLRADANKEASDAG